MKIRLGSLQPQQVARLQVTLIMQLEIVLGSYHFELPLALYPDYSRCEVEAGAFQYDFNYKLVFLSETKMQNFIIPEVT